MMPNLNSVPSEHSHDIRQDWARQLDAAQRDGSDAPNRAVLFDSLLTDYDRKFLWAMWIDFRKGSWVEARDFRPAKRAPFKEPALAPES